MVNIEHSTNLLSIVSYYTPAAINNLIAADLDFSKYSNYNLFENNQHRSAINIISSEVVGPLVI